MGGGSGFLRLSAQDSQKIVTGAAIGAAGLLVAGLACIVEPHLTEQPQVLLSLQTLAAVAINAGRKALVDSRTDGQREADARNAAEKAVQDLRAQLRLAEARLADAETKE